MNPDDVLHLNKLISTHKQRLRHLEIQAARFGDFCDPHILTEISTIKDQIQSLERNVHDGASDLYIHKKEYISNLTYRIDAVERQLSLIRINETKVYKLFGVIPIWSVTSTIIQTFKLLMIIAPGLIAIAIGFSVLTADLRQPIFIRPTSIPTPTLTNTPILRPTSHRTATLVPTRITVTSTPKPLQPKIFPRTGVESVKEENFLIAGILIVIGFIWIITIVASPTGP